MVFEIGLTEPDDFSNEALKLLRGIGGVSLYAPESQTLKDFIKNKHALFVRLQHYWGYEQLHNAQNLRFLCTPTTGLTHIDMDYAAAAKINVISLKGETAFLKTISATAEHSFGLALALLRRYGHSFLRRDSFAWDRDKFKGYEMKHMRAGIIGMGRIGARLSGYLHAFGAETYYYDIRENVENPHNAHRVDSLCALVDAADIVFLCASYEKENVHMMDANILCRMKGKYFVNTSRGELVDEEELLSLIRKGFFAGVALDVVEGEPGATRAMAFSTLSSRHNLLITPHIGGATYSSMWATEEFIAEKLIAALR